MTKQFFRLLELLVVLKISELSLRKMFNDAGINPPLDEDISNPLNIITRNVLANFVIDRAGSREARVLDKLLKE